MRSDELQDLLSIARSRAKSEGAEMGIGTYGEKLLHRSLKYYFEPNSDFHEVAFNGSVADIKNGEGIIEIQTRSFEKLVPKLERFLDNAAVTIVYPIIERKRICRIDFETGEVLSSKISPKRGKITDALAEISKIRKFIPNPNLTILLVFLDATETRTLCKKNKIGRHKTDKVDCEPTSINSILELKTVEDFVALLPDGLPDEFTSKDFESITKLHAIELHNSLLFLLGLNILKRERINGRAYVYSLNSSRKNES